MESKLRLDSIYLALQSQYQVPTLRKRKGNLEDG